MEGAYFVGRKEVLEWVNNTCALSLTKIEDTASGCAACMLLDQLHPGQISMTKVNWNAKQSHEWVGNYKVLQTAFSKLKIDRHIDVDRLISGKYMDNLEFMQWFKRFYEIQNGSACTPEGYDPVEARCKGKGGSTFNMASSGADSGAMKRSNTAPGAVDGTGIGAAKREHVGAAKKTANTSENNQSEEKKKQARTNSANKALEESTNKVPSARERVAATKEAAKEKAAATAAARRETTANAANLKARGKESSSAPIAPGSPCGSASGRLSSNAAIVANKALVNEVQGLNQANTDMRNEMIGLEKERDFYFDKLRDIEILLQDMEEDVDIGKGAGAAVLSSKIFKILYATAEGFVQSPSAQNVSSAVNDNDSAAKNSPVTQQRPPSSEDGSTSRSVTQSYSHSKSPHNNNNNNDDNDDDNDVNCDEPMSPVKYPNWPAKSNLYEDVGDYNDNNGVDDDEDESVPPPPEGDEDEEEEE